MYYIYILRCEDESLYTGITTDPERRFREHQSSPKGAKYTKVHRPVEMAYLETAENRSEASKREYAVKHMKREDKLKLIEEYHKNYSEK